MSEVCCVLLTLWRPG